MVLPGQSYTGYSDDALAEKNAVTGVWVSHMEAAVLLAVSRGHDTAAAIVAETGLTFGQVHHAIGVLRTQGLTS